jgi:hypothetical protein
MRSRRWLLLVPAAAIGIYFWFKPHKDDAPLDTARDLTLVDDVHDDDGDDDAVASDLIWELKSPGPEAKTVESRNQLMVSYRAGNRIHGGNRVLGLMPCSNYPRKLDGNAWGTQGNVSLVAFPDETVEYGKHRGIAVRLINRTGRTVYFNACDSCLSIVQEALAADGQWLPIERSPLSFCALSFHGVSLRSDKYWAFPAPLYSGPFKTRLRFRLEWGYRGWFYSNEFEGSVHPDQFDGSIRFLDENDKGP